RSLTWVRRVIQRVCPFASRNEPAKLNRGGSGEFEQGGHAELRILLEARNSSVEMVPRLRRFGPDIGLRPETAWIIKTTNFNRQILRVLLVLCEERDSAMIA